MTVQLNLPLELVDRFIEAGCDLNSAFEHWHSTIALFNVSPHFLSLTGAKSCRIKRHWNRLNSRN